MTSRATESHRRQSLATLRQLLLQHHLLTGIEVSYDVGRGFSVQLNHVTICSGRYEKVSAWLAGYINGRRDAVRERSRLEHEP